MFTHNVIINKPLKYVDKNVTTNFNFIYLNTKIAYDSISAFFLKLSFFVCGITIKMQGYLVCSFAHSVEYVPFFLHIFFNKLLLES